MMRGETMKNNLVAFSIFFLGVCFVIGSYLISNAINRQPKSTKISNAQHQLLTQSELARYLGLSEEEIQQLTEYPTGEGGFTSEIPHIKSGNTFYYPKSAIDQWLLKVQLTIVP